MTYHEFVLCGNFFAFHQQDKRRVAGETRSRIAIVVIDVSGE
jgi:hypothetical protein